MQTVKPFEISKHLIWEAYKSVKANGGTSGVDQESMEDFERNLKDNLYKIWNRMSSGSYFPPAVKGVSIPKKSGGHRLLSVPTISDRVAQTVVKMVLEPLLEPIFDDNSFGYRPKRPAHDALAITRERCWKYDWVVEFDIKGLFDNIDHSLLMKALRKHCDCKWVLLYVKRWLKAPLQDTDGNLIERTKGTPQGGVVSPLLSNLFMHYVFDAWIKKEVPSIPFCRYVDDIVLHCYSKRQAEYSIYKVKQRLEACGLTMHPEKSGIVYCKDKNRKGTFERISFDFLGYTFRPRRCVNQQGLIHPNFLPAISSTSKKAIRQEIRSWRLQLKNSKSLIDISRMFDATIRGWSNYYGGFYPSAMNGIWKHLDYYLMRWVKRKYKNYKKHTRRANEYLARLALSNPNLFTHWRLGVLPVANSGGSRMS